MLILGLLFPACFIIEQEECKEIKTRNSNLHEGIILNLKDLLLVGISKIVDLVVEHIFSA
jgi:hypothetical protein